MSSPLEKPLGESPALTSENCADQTDWQKVEGMDDEDIIFTEDSPDSSEMDWSNAVSRVGGRPCTVIELEEFKQFCGEYADRPRRIK